MSSPRDPDLKPSQRMARISAQTGQPISVGAPKSGGNEKVFHAAERSAEFFDHLRVHYRETRRTDVDIPVELKVLLKDGAVADTGTATVVNISPSGALLANMRLGKNSYPTVPFRFEMILKGGDYDGIGVEAVPVRFEFDRGGIAVKFVEIFVSADDEEE